MPSLSLLSNVGMLVPVSFALFHGLTIAAVALAVAAVASAIYHVDETVELHKQADTVGVYFLMVYSWFLFLDSDFIITIANGVSFVFGMIALFFYLSAPDPHHAHFDGEPGSWDDYDQRHALWHVFISASFLAFLFSYCFTTVYKAPVYDSCKRIESPGMALVLMKKLSKSAWRRAAETHAHFSGKIRRQFGAGALLQDPNSNLSLKF